MDHASDSAERRASPAGHRHARAPLESGHPRRVDVKLSAEEINRLEIAAYHGPIHVVRSRQQMPAAIRALSRETLLGFDTETRPVFTKGTTHPPALIQLASREAVYVFQLTVLGLPVELTAVLADPRIIKAGVAIQRDVQELRKLTEFHPRGFVDLGACTRQCGMQHHGLRGMAALLLGCRISKSAQLTNWERHDLPRAALTYAATDAWISRRLYEALKEQGCLDATPGPATGLSEEVPRLGFWRQASAALAGIVRRARSKSL